MKLTREEGSDDSELGHVDLSNVKELYGYPHQVGHRSSLAGSIYEGCKREGAVKFHFSTSVSDLKDFSPKPSFTVTPRSSDVQPYEVHCDILLACDGVKSVCRGRMLEGLGTEDAVADSGQAAYRIMLTREQMQHDAELLELLDSDRVTRWIGPRRHMIAYPVQGKTIYNISTAQSDVNFAAAPSATYTTRGSKTAMKDVFDDFCPLVQRMLELVPEGEVCEWKLRVHSPLPTWVHGSVALVGDACHPTLPHLNQGAAQAIEDAAVIAVCLSHLQDTEPASITKALKCYEKVRKERAERLVEMAAFSGKTMQLGEGAAKQERDRQFAALKEGKGPVPDKWADSEVQRMIFGFDCVRAAEDFMAPRH